MAVIAARFSPGTGAWRRLLPAGVSPVNQTVIGSVGSGSHRTLTESSRLCNGGHPQVDRAAGRPNSGRAVGQAARQGLVGRLTAPGLVCDGGSRSEESFDALAQGGERVAVGPALRGQADRGDVQFRRHR